jgi:hypothetical protein
VKLSHYPFRVAQWCGSHTAVVFLLWSLWLAFEYFGFGPASYVRIHDNGDILLPAKLACAPALADGQLGYWNPLLVSGMDTLAQSFTTEIDCLLFAVKPGWLVYGFIMLIQRFVAGYFTFRLLKEFLNLHTLPALYAGLAYSLFAQGTINNSWAGFTLHHGMTLPGLPFLLWSMSHINAGSMHCSYLYAVGLGILLSITSSYAYTLFLIPAAFYWFLFVTPISRPKFWVIVVTFAAAWSFSEWLILWAGFLNGPLSHRADWLPNSPLSASGPSQLSFVHGLVRENAVPLGLASIALITSRARNYRLVSLFGAVVVCLGFVLGYRSLTMVVHNHLGWLSGFQFDYVYLLIPFLASVSGGVGAHLLGREWHDELATQTSYRYGLPLQTLLILGALSLIAWQSLNIKYRTLNEMSQGSNFATLYNQPALQQLAENRRSLPPFRVATITIPWRHLQHPSYVWAYGLESADGYVSLYLKRYQDFWEQVIGPLIALDQDRYNYFHYWGNRVYLFSPSGGFPLSNQVPVKDYYNVKLLSLANVRYIISPLPIEDENLALLPSYVRDEQFRWQDRRFRYKLVGLLTGQYPGIPLYTYENRQVLPRFFLTGQVRLFDDPTQLLGALGGASYEDLRLTAYIERTDARDLPLDRLGGRNGEIVIRTYSADRIILDVSADSPSILIATNSFSPFWRAQVDSTEAKILPVNHAFQGVYVEGGQHEVMLEYAPPYAISLDRQLSGGRPARQ